VTGWRDDVLLIRVTAPPVDSAANAAVIELLASALRIPKRDITIVRGDTSRVKQLAIDGLADADIRARLHHN